MIKSIRCEEIDGPLLRNSIKNIQKSGGHKNERK